MLGSCFSPDYFTARQRFRAAATAAGFSLSDYPIAAATERAGLANNERLTMDAATIGDPHAERALVVTSGVHGVEGFFGSAVQLALLDALQAQRLIIASATRIVLLHAINPFGFAKVRRWNEDSIDLNRNFLRDGEAYAGSPPLYGQVDRWLNPRTPPHRGLTMPIHAIVDVARYGIGALMQSIPVGQYDYPQGLFFGGQQRAESTRVVDRELPTLIGDAQQVTHLDFHTGLGKFGTYQLLLDLPDNHADVQWFRSLFGRHAISALPAASGVAQETKVYSARGGFGSWCVSRFADRHYRFATAEFGTYSPARVLLALRQENRAHHWGVASERYTWTKRRLMEVFVPASAAWRQQVVGDGLQLICTALSVQGE
jgi:hypothetical protein